MSRTSLFFHHKHTKLVKIFVFILGDSDAQQNASKQVHKSEKPINRASLPERKLDRGFMFAETKQHRTTFTLLSLYLLVGAFHSRTRFVTYKSLAVKPSTDLQ